MLKIFNVVAAIVLFFFIASTAKPSPAFAASHGIRGCVTIQDDREYGASEPSATQGEFVPLVDTPIPIYIIDILGFNTYVGDLTTNSSGCFSGTVEGLGVPDNTTITAQMKLENSDYRVTDDSGTWLYELGKKSLVAGEGADFGMFYGGSTSNGAAMMWVTAHDGVDFHDAQMGAGAWASRGYPQLTVEYPLDDNVSNTNSSRIGITEGSRDNLNTYLHEFGHWIGHNDAASNGDLGNYCKDYVGSTYPYTERPYLFIDTPDKDGYCGWHSTAYETEKHVMSESHANLIRNVLWDGGCSETYEPVEFNTDGEHTVHAVGRALCDLLDTGTERVSALHSYGDPGNITVATPAVNLFPAGHLSGSTAYGTDGSKIYSVNITTGAMKEIYDMTSTGETMAIVSSDGTSLCATTKTGSLYCGKTSGTGTMFKQTLPTNSLFMFDVIVSGSKFYATGRVSTSSVKIYSGDLKNLSSSSSTAKIKTAIVPHISLKNWKEIYSEPYVSSDLQPKFIAVNAAKTNLYLSRENWIETCSLSGSAIMTKTTTTPRTMATSSTPLCSTGTTVDFAGSRSYAGYRRSTPTNSYLDNITLIEINDGNLYITDTNGVAKINLNSPTAMEQYLGAGEDKIFLNNLSRRSLSFDTGTTSFFAISGTRALFQPSTITKWNNHRGTDLIEYGMFLIDDSKAVHQEYYCGAEDVRKDVGDVVHAFVGHAYDVSLDDFLRVNMGLSEKEVLAIEHTNWTSLNACQTANISGTAITEDLTGSGSSTTTSSSSSSSAEKFSLEDVPCGEADPDSQLPAQGQTRATTPFESIPPDGTEKLSVSPSYDTPTPLEKN